MGPAGYVVGADCCEIQQTAECKGNNTFRGRNGAIKASLTALKLRVASSYNGKEFAPNNKSYSEAQLKTILHDALDMCAAHQDQAT